MNDYRQGGPHHEKDDPTRDLVRRPAGSALVEDQRQQRRPDDVKKYLKHLDSVE